VNLPVERPLSPLLTHSISHHHSSDVAVGALVCLIDPSLDHIHVHDLHVEELDVIVKAGHVPDKGFAPAPCALRVVGQHFPHLVEPFLGVQPHEPHLEGGRRDRSVRGLSDRFEERWNGRYRTGHSGADRCAHELAEVISRPRLELSGNTRHDGFNRAPAAQTAYEAIDQ
jgi:hypothetical protein